MSNDNDYKNVNKRGEYVNFGTKWLIDHHTAKEQHRQKMIEDVNPQSGDIVLDLGCGPGLWSSLLSEKVKPGGRVIGFDADENFIKYASENFAEDSTDVKVEFHNGNFYSLPFEDKMFDLVFFGNCFAYVTDPQKVLIEQKRVTKKGGRIAIKDFEGAVLVINPIEPILTLKVLAAAARGLKDNPPDPPFDNFSGKKLRGILLKAGLKNVSVNSYGVHILPPLTEEARRYITVNAKWYAEKGRPYLSEEDFKKWNAYFDPSSDQYVLELEEFYFCMLEVLVIGEV